MLRVDTEVEGSYLLERKNASRIRRGSHEGLCENVLVNCKALCR